MRFRYLIALVLVALALTGGLAIIPLTATARTYAYIPSHDSDSILRINTEGSTYSSADLNVTTCHPYGAAVYPSGEYVLVTCSDGDDGDTTTGRLLRFSNSLFISNGTATAIAVGNDPRGVAVDTAGNYAYITNFRDNTVSMINLNTTFTGSFRATIAVGDGPWGVAAYYDEENEISIAYVSNSEDGTISVIIGDELDDNHPVGNQPIGLALSPDGATLYVADHNNGGAGFLYVVNTSDMAVVEEIPMVMSSWGVAVGNEGKSVYVTSSPDSGSGKISIYTPSNPNDITDIDTTGGGLTGIAAPKNGSFALAVSRTSDEVYKVTAASSEYETMGVGRISNAYALGAFIGGTPPTAPSSLEATAEEAGAVVLTWTDNADDELGYRIERRKEGEDTYVQIAKAAASATSYTDKHVEESTAYEYRICAFNEVADSTYASISDAVTTLEEPFSWCFIGCLLD